MTFCSCDISGGALKQCPLRLCVKLYLFHIKLTRRTQRDILRTRHQLLDVAPHLLGGGLCVETESDLHCVVARVSHRVKRVAVHRVRRQIVDCVRPQHEAGP